jgi:Zn-dependent M28 family amino/carboxypeptidase
VMMHAAPQGADSPDPKPTPAQWARIRVSLDSLRRLHPARLDSIYNGADDDGSGSVALLEIAERFATAPVKPKRSVIFAWHVGEEEGMLGSGFFTDHPTVKRDSIVAELNIDMIGRGKPADATGEDKNGKLLHGGPGYLQLIGSRRLSTELGNMVEQENARDRLGLKFDYALDANGHPQNIYCRSDHWSYARWGIPIVFFTTGGHADYHQVTDEPEYIDYDHMATVTRLIHATAMNVANLSHRVAVDHPKPDPHGDCRQ